MKLTKKIKKIAPLSTATSRSQDHPYHIHGTNMHVVAAATVGANVSMASVRALNEQGGIPKRLDASAPLKDTISVPSQGYAVVRFRANNPGASAPVLNLIALFMVPRNNCLL